MIFLHSKCNLNKLKFIWCVHWSTVVTVDISLRSNMRRHTYTHTQHCWHLSRPDTLDTRVTKSCWHFTLSKHTRTRTHTQVWVRTHTFPHSGSVTGLCWRLVSITRCKRDKRKRETVRKKRGWKNSFYGDVTYFPHESSSWGRHCSLVKEGQNRNKKYKY